MSKTQCTACLEVYPTECFYVDKKRKNGLMNRCIVCSKNRNKSKIRQPRVNKLSPTQRKQNHKNNCKKYEKTKPGFLMRAYRNMQSRVTGVQSKKAHLYLGLELLSRAEFYALSLSSDDFNSLFDTWTKAGYIRKISPSVDRVDSSKGYTKENIRWVTHSQNSREGSLSQWSRRTSILTSKRSA